ncbi:MAG: 3-hydroxyacyl-CoA dehydrogenase [Limosilactobacillus sp.]|jgi:3-hydroxybutyryl-CoA dehydrogenase|uniref:3-hydroxyacyl-CoA dehydrogenase n=1 Tax=Limosilactobacillus sp. TaxID=2773925 RepID=UPI0025C045F3|nr:3-hydroxyacyl-CoA dehydrogenase [Limosilactobacillus sp.]MCI1974718.1 3-hydroxyacyl-CoA dehydrogenase [Limosilactobacillus sp.]MCI2030725.1 3-hydroxyacyl-CoA dehydrogenase [Limosilactobacillus sp.]
MAFKNITIAGAGTLGSQIAYQTALCGFKVSIYNRHVDKAEHRLEALRKYYKQDVGLTDEQFQAGLDNIVTITTDLKEAVADADYVIEALPESLKFKEDFYQKLSKVAPEKTVFASNSSSFVPSQLVGYVDRPAKFLHMHFANKIWRFNVAEIIGTDQTDLAVYQEVVDFARAIKMVPIELHREQHGYVLNAILMPLLASAMQLWVNDISDPQTIDKDWMISTHSPMGPFMILDMVGLRTPYQMELNTYEATHDEIHQRIADKLKAMIDAGHVGQETGQGFYHYPNPEFEDPNFLKA